MFQETEDTVGGESGKGWDTQRMLAAGVQGSNGQHCTFVEPSPMSRHRADASSPRERV